MAREVTLDANVIVAQLEYEGGPMPDPYAGLLGRRSASLDRSSTSFKKLEAVSTSMTDCL
jgi:hypothetical protein